MKPRHTGSTGTTRCGSKYLVHTRSKYHYPTTLKKDGGRSDNGGMSATLRCGATPAKKDIERVLGRSLQVAKTRHSRSQWIFCEALPAGS